MVRTPFGVEVVPEEKARSASRDCASEGGMVCKEGVGGVCVARCVAVRGWSFALGGPEMMMGAEASSAWITSSREEHV